MYVNLPNELKGASGALSCFFGTILAAGPESANNLAISQSLPGKRCLYGIISKKRNIPAISWYAICMHPTRRLAFSYNGGIENFLKV